MRRLVIASIPLVVMLNACSSTAGTAPVRPSPSAASTPLPAMWGTYADQRQGYSVALPTSWDVVTRDSPTFAANIKTISDQSTDLGTYFTDSFAKNDQLRLLAADPRTLPQGFAANVNVMISDLGADATAPTLDDVVKAKVKRLSAAAEVGKPLLRHNDRLSGLGAVRLDYTLTVNRTSVRVRSLVVEIERKGRQLLVELTMGAPASGAESLFTAEQRLFTLFTPGGPAPSPRPAATPSGARASGESQTSSGWTKALRYASPPSAGGMSSR